VQTVPKRLPPREIHLWCFPQDDDAVDVEAARWLSPDDMARAARFTVSRDGSRFLRRRGVLRSVIAGYEDLSGMELRRARCPTCGEEHGQPHLTSSSGPDVALTASASDDGAVFAVARVPRLGVDLESPDNEALLRGAGDLILTDGERAQLEAIGPGGDVAAAMLRLWTLKEAYLKATGVGLLDDPRSVDTVALGPGDHIAAADHSREPCSRTAWRASTSLLPDGRLVTLVWHGPCQRVRRWTVLGNKTDAVGPA
jgi:4'-phosphopantetheinyl transferase